MHRISRSLTFLSVAVAGVGLGLPGAAVASTAATTWGPVVTVADQRFDQVQSVTTDNGLVVVAWNGNGFKDLSVAFHRPGQSWSSPIVVAGKAAAFSLVRDGDRAWLAWQDFTSVSIAEVTAAGTLGTPVVLGPSSDPFSDSPVVAVGANGAMAVAWHQKSDRPLLAYRAAGGETWSSPESVPKSGRTIGIVVGAKGVAQVGLSHDSTLYDLRRSTSGTWHHQVVSTVASVASMAGNAHGDIVFGWEIANADDSFSLAARYLSAETGLGTTEHLADDVPYGARVRLAMARSGAVVAAYRTNDSGSQEVALTPADVDGEWAATQTLGLVGDGYDVTMDRAGDALVTGFRSSGGLDLVRCPAGGSCGATETNPATGFRFPSASLSGQGIITLVWGRGCKTEECVPTRLVAQRGF